VPPAPTASPLAPPPARWRPPPACSARRQLVAPAASPWRPPGRPWPGPWRPPRPSRNSPFRRSAPNHIPALRCRSSHHRLGRVPWAARPAGRIAPARPPAEPTLMPFFASPIGGGGNIGGQRRRKQGRWLRRVGRVGRKDLPGSFERGNQGDDPQEAKVHESPVLESRDRRLIDAASPLEPTLRPTASKSRSSELLAQASHAGGFMSADRSALRLP